MGGGGCNPLFFSCSYIDLAHFLITSTTREFRKKYLDAVLSAYVNQLDDILESQGRIQWTFRDYRVVQKILPHIKLGHPMHSPSALTELAASNLDGIFLLHTVEASLKFQGQISRKLQVKTCV